MSDPLLYSPKQKKGGFLAVERVIVSIDGSNFYHQCQANLGRTDVNLGAFAEFLVDRGERS